ncbi:hypothetical protein [Actinokineospora globicatena]|uniref:hypothetical protein n=1 Tax=Actinokineospora globicatena TaxID=103729 RepID=UPI0020A53EEC|nr:hypothetical protein [Actinokineospora globicatena]GLW79644.1 hypothetical protein Aglo01_41250 [Actinokineospora globicatena]GLW85946.1 hypothetical protein Aglo02_35860 [Actinokineospora globicatena]
MNEHLHKLGVLTVEEFGRKKQKLLVRVERCPQGTVRPPRYRRSDPVLADAVVVWG